MTIALIDYEMGNLRSVAKALEAVGGPVVVTRDKAVIASASKVVLPGVGAFSKCMENLKQFDLVDPIKKSIQSGKNFLGICLGLQLLFDESEEFGPTKGLGIIPGKVKKFEFSAPHTDLKIPHMGWNAIKQHKECKFLEGMEDLTPFYFVHSYYVVPDDRHVIASETDYGFSFCSSIEKDNIMACQFHPEKSQKAGLQLLKNFVELP